MWRYQATDGSLAHLSFVQPEKVNLKAQMMFLPIIANWKCYLGWKCLYARLPIIMVREQFASKRAYSERKKNWNKRPV